MCGELEAAGYFWGSNTESGGEKLVLSGGRDQIRESLDLRFPWRWPEAAEPAGQSRPAAGVEGL